MLGSFGITSEGNKVAVGSRFLIKGANPDPSKGNPTRGTRALACKPGVSPPRVADLPEGGRQPPNIQNQSNGSSFHLSQRRVYVNGSLAMEHVCGRA